MLHDVISFNREVSDNKSSDNRLLHVSNYCNLLLSTSRPKWNVRMEMELAKIYTYRYICVIFLCISFQFIIYWHKTIEIADNVMPKIYLVIRKTEGIRLTQLSIYIALYLVSLIFFSLMG